MIDELQSTQPCPQNHPTTFHPTGQCQPPPTYDSQYQPPPTYDSRYPNMNPEPKTVQVSHTPSANTHLYKLHHNNPLGITMQYMQSNP